MQRYIVDPKKLMKRGNQMLTNAAYLKSCNIQSKSMLLSKCCIELNFIGWLKSYIHI